jgi:hypothetical protein
MTAPPQNKLIEVTLLLEAINIMAAREKSILCGHLSILNLCRTGRSLMVSMVEPR